MKPIVLITLYLSVTLSPLLLAWLGARPGRNFWDEIATGAGLLAFAIILVEFVLSGRFRTISRTIGMDVTMRFHQLLARTALALALLHPFLYQSPFNPQLPWDPSRQLTLTHDLGSLGTGILGWVLLVTLIVLSIGREGLNYRYETWRLMHGIGAAVIAALVLHHTLTAGRYSADPLLANTWIAMFALSMTTLAYVYIVRPLGQMRRPWRVSQVRPLGLKTWSLAIEPVGHNGIAYNAGQFVWLNVGNSVFSLRENPFSIASAPSSGPQLEFIIKELGDFTRTIEQIAPNTPAYIDGPHGNLITAGRRETGIALIAGGVGIAPLIGILRQLRIERDERPTLLVYGNRTAEQIVAKQEIDHLSLEHGTEVVLTVSQPEPGWTGEVGLIDAPLIRRHYRAEMKDWLFVLCGPGAMMETVEDTLIELGVPSAQILSERFQYD